MKAFLLGVLKIVALIVVFFVLQYSAAILATVNTIDFFRQDFMCVKLLK